MLICLLLVLVTLATFRQVKDHAFINFDDQEYVYENPQVQAGLTFQGIKWAFTTSHAANWHPLTWLSHMLDCQLFGLKPAWHHLMNLFFHIASTLLLFLVLNRMTKAVYQSAFVAALFALHPLHVESVAWVAERKDVLSAFFWMLTMGAYAHYAERPAIRRYLLVLLFFVLGLMSKPMLVTLPFVLLLMDYWPLGRLQPVKPVASASITLSPSKKPGQKKRKNKNHPHPSLPHRGGGIKGVEHFLINNAAQDKTTGLPYQWSIIRFLVLEKVPLFILTAISCVITSYAQKKGGAMAPLQELPLDTRMGNALLSYVSYIGKMIWPQNMAVFYPYPFVQPLWQVFGAALILVLITVMVIGRAKQFPYLAVGWFWFMGTLAPVIGLVQVGRQAMADRYTYIPFIGLFIMVAWGLLELLKKWRFQKAVIALSAGVILLACTIVTYIQLQYWRDSITLFRHALIVTKDNDVAHNNLGDAFRKKGNIEEAISHYREAIRINPDYRQAHNDMGTALLEKGNIEEALSHYQEAIRIDPNYGDAYYNMGEALFKHGDISGSLFYLREALRIAPDDADTHYNIANVLLSQGKADEAIVHLKEALRIKPDHIGAHNNLGIALASQGQIGEAIAHFTEAVRINPNDEMSYNNMGKALFSQGRIGDAIASFRTALRLKPDFAEAHYNLGAILASQGMPGEAANHFAEVIRLNPNDARAHNNMGRALLAQGKIDDAVAHFREALRINPDLTPAKDNLREALGMRASKNEK